MIPDLAGGAAAELDGLRTATTSAIADMLAAGPQKIILVGTGESAARLAPPFAFSFAPWGVPVRMAQPGPAPDATAVPLSVGVGMWLLDRARPGWPAGLEFAAEVVPPDEKPADCAARGAVLAEEPGRLGLLIMGDGTARRTEKAPGALDPRAAGFDALVAAALVAGDPAALSALDADLAAELLVAGRAAWQVMAGATAGTDWSGTLYYADAPYGVGYLVASWRPA